MKNKIIIGLTGPIASGKDTVARILGRHGAYIINADKVGHEVMRPQTKTWHHIVKDFGSKVLNKGGIVNRRKLARIVFSDKKKLAQLDRVMHPEMRGRIKEMIKAAKDRKKKLIIINAAILLEMGLLPFVDKVITVMASEKTRLKRLIRCGRARTDALARIKAQASAAKYRKISDIVIMNDKSIKELKGKIKRIVSSLEQI